MFHRLVVPMDFSECAREAWSMAKRLGAAPGSELILTHVLTEIPRFGEGPLTVGPGGAVAVDARARLGD